MENIKELTIEDLQKRVNEINIEINDRKKSVSEKLQKEEILKTEKRFTRIINKFGKENFNKFKALVRKVNKYELEEDVIIQINPTIKYDIWIDGQEGSIIYDSYNNDYNLDDIFDDVCGKKMAKLKKDVDKELLKYKNICKSKRIKISNILGIIHYTIEDEDETIRDIIE